MKEVFVSGSFDNLRSHDVRFLQEASALGPLHVLLWSDAVVQAALGKRPSFPEQERHYVVQAMRYVTRVTVVSRGVTRDTLVLPADAGQCVWAVGEDEDDPQKRAFCRSRGVEYRIITRDGIRGFPPAHAPGPQSPRSTRRVLVTGCYDWFHSGHVRFFEEVSALGELYVVVGHDANIRLLKGDAHPMFAQEERRYMVQAVRYVTQALISTGDGWLDAAPEITKIRPDIYAVNADGDKPEKREFCASHGIEYVVLTRTPKEGLPRRESTKLRGF